jgi:thermitase
MRLAVGLLCLMVAVSAVGPVSAATDEGYWVEPTDPADILEGEIVVRFGPILPSKAAQQAFAATVGLEEITRIPEIGWVRYRITDGERAVAKIAVLRGRSEIADADPVVLGDVLAFPSDPPNDPRWDEQWGMRRADIPAAWRIAGGGNSTKPIGILDTGVDLDHPDLGYIYGRNFVGGTTWGDSCGHGTVVAGVAAAFANNQKGIAGVAYNAPIYSLKIARNSDCRIDAAAAADAIIWAVNNGVWAITASWSVGASNPDVSILKDAVDYAWSQDVMIVAAVPNGDHDGFDNSVPARWYKVVTVGGTDSNNRRCRWKHPLTNEQVGANYGEPGIDVSAPCLNITTTTNGGGYDTFNGTSVAVPLVAGVIHLMKSEHPSWSSQRIKDELWRTADHVGGYSYSWHADSCLGRGQSKDLGCGLIDADAAVD